MAAGGPWSVKGIAPQAREAAKDAARRQGKTLGEWLNEIILETGDEAAAPDAPTGGSMPAPEAGEDVPQDFPRDFSRDFSRETAANTSSMSLESLARRLEAVEHRSTLAITGIDQSVRGLISRMEESERSAGDRVDQAGESVSELHHAQSELARRLAALEADTTAKSGLEAVKSLEGAVAKVAGHLHERDEKSAERAGRMEERLSDLDTRFVKTSEDLARRVDTASDHAAMQAQRATNDLRQAFETHQDKTADALASLEATIGRINERLSSAEGLTDNAMRSLEASFAHLDDRLRKAEHQAHEASADNVADKLEQKFEALGRELRERIDEVRAETAQTIEASTPRLDRLERALEKSTKRNTRTLNKIGEQIGVLGQAVEKRLEDTERRLREDASQDRTLETRLREVENSSAEAIRKVAESVEQISIRLAERIETSEGRNADAVSTLSKEMAKLADRMTPQAQQKSEDDSLAARLRESERRTQKMIRDAVAGVSAKLDAVRDETESGLSPVQSALANLAGRLEAMENGEEPPEHAPVRPAPPRSDAPRPYRSSLPPAEDALSVLGPQDSYGEEAEEEPEAEEEVAIDPPARPNPFTDEGHNPPPETGGWSDSGPDLPEPEPDSDVLVTPPPPAELPAEARPAPEEDEAPKRPLGATADSNFLARARKSARSTPSGESPRAARARSSVLETREERAGGGGRRVLILAGLLAVATLGAAAALLFMDGGPFGDSGPRVAGEMNDPEVAETLNGESSEEFALVDGQADGPPDLGLPGGAGEATAPAESAELEEPASAPAGEDGAETVIAEAPAEPDLAGEPAAGEPAVDVAETAVEPAPEETQTAEAEPPAAEETPAPTPEARIISDPEPVQETPVAAAPVEPAPVESAPVETAPVETAAAQPAPEPVPAPQPEAAAPVTALEQAAFDGDPMAQYQLGEMELQTGDPEQGARLIRASANQGNAPAQYRLGKLYETGAAGVPQDDVQARMWTERAANAGNRNAMHNLGLMYAEGRGIEQSDQMAAQWFERAALIGATDSQFNLAVLYEQGRGVPQSLPDAYAWYRIAERAGDVEAGDRADLIGAQIPEGAVAEAQRVADAFQPRAADPSANGAFANASAAASQPDMVQRAQQMLAALGYNPGVADGNVGPQTRLAIIQYQRDNGMNATGTVDSALLANLEAAAP